MSKPSATEYELDAIENEAAADAEAPTAAREPDTQSDADSSQSTYLDAVQRIKEIGAGVNPELQPRWMKLTKNRDYLFSYAAEKAKDDNLGWGDAATATVEAFTKARTALKTKTLSTNWMKKVIRDELANICREILPKDRDVFYRDGEKEREEKEKAGEPIREGVLFYHASVADPSRNVDDGRGSERGTDGDDKEATEFLDFHDSPYGGAEQGRKRRKGRKTGGRPLGKERKRPTETKAIRNYRREVLREPAFTPEEFAWLQRARQALPEEYRDLLPPAGLIEMLREERVWWVTIDKVQQKCSSLDTAAEVFNVPLKEVRKFRAACLAAAGAPNNGSSLRPLLKYQMRKPLPCNSRVRFTVKYMREETPQTPFGGHTNYVRKYPFPLSTGLIIPDAGATALTRRAKIRSTESR